MFSLIPENELFCVMIEAGESVDIIKAWSTIVDIINHGHVATQMGQKVWIWDRPPNLLWLGNDLFRLSYWGLRYPAEEDVFRAIIEE